MKGKPQRYSNFAKVVELNKGRHLDLNPHGLALRC